MSKIILQPSGNKDAREHYNDTIKNRVLLKTIKPHIADSDFKKLTDIYPNGDCLVWGVTPGGSNLTKWNRINRGDVTLFSKSGEIFASAVTTYKLQSKSLASLLWNFNSKGQTWEYIYFLDEVKRHSIPYIDFNRAVGYADNYIIQGFNVLTPEKSDSVLKAFDLESDVYTEELSASQYEDLIDKLDSLSETESQILSTRRLEQGYLKKNLFGNRTVANCAICKNELPISFLVTAHIKKRAYCNSMERKDINVVMPMCKLGCDEIYEKGYISVDEGIFVDLEKSPNSPHLQEYIKQVSGKNCDFFKDETKNYFDWHLNHHK